MAKIKRLVRREERRKNRSKKTSRMHPSRLRVVVFRSLKHFEVQVINDFKGHTIVSVSSKEKKIICVFGSLYLCGNILNKN